jgi:hypothetical protein
VFIRFEKPLENIRREEMFVRNHRHVGEWRQGAEVSPKERAIKEKNIIMIRMMVIARQESPRLILAIAICQLAGALGSVNRFKYMVP